jgi:plasmid stabilization system protein ParE
MRVRFEPSARDELKVIFAWIAKDNPTAALDRIEARVMRLALPELADMGRPGLIEGTRELLEYPYILVYKIDFAHEEIRFISVVHGAQSR